MNPEVSRRVAWAMRFLRMTIKQSAELCTVAEQAQSFDDLPDPIKQLIIEVEKVHGTNPNL